MEMAEIARTMRARMSWPVAQRVLRERDIPRSHGWEKTIAALSDETTDFSAKIDEGLEALVEHHLCGEKLVRIFEIDKDVKAQLLKKIAKLPIPKTTFSEKYPLYLSETELEAAPEKPTLVAIEKKHSGIGLIFASARVITTREVIADSKLKDGVADQYDEVYGLKEVRHQAMDIVWVPAKGNHVDVRVDFPLGMHRDVGEAAHAVVASRFHEIIGLDLLSQPVNLFSLINRIYSKPKEGMVVELGFGTTTASNKLEKMRRKNLCLREEIYHIGGKAALETDIEPYRLSVVWKVPIGGKKFSLPELGLNTTSRISSSALPVMTGMIIRNCMGSFDFDHVRDRVEHFLAA